jgi:hypothetical protein
VTFRDKLVTQVNFYPMMIIGPEIGLITIEIHHLRSSPFNCHALKFNFKKSLVSLYFVGVDLYGSHDHALLSPGRLQGHRTDH